MLLELPFLAGAPSEGGLSTPVILVLLVSLVSIVVLLSLIQHYKRCPANKIMVISGKTGHGPARCLHGGAAFVWPVIQEVAFLNLEPVPVEDAEVEVVSRDNVAMSVQMRATVAISQEREMMAAAAAHLLGRSSVRIGAQAGEVIVGWLRTAASTLTADEILNDRQEFVVRATDGTSDALASMGLEIVSLNLGHIRVQDARKT